MNIKYILSHSIQYQSPLIKFLTKKGLKIKVLFRSDMSTKKYFDTEFKKIINWGTNLLDGFDYEYLNYVGPNKVDAIFPLTTDFTNKIIDKDTDIIWLHGIKNWYNLKNVKFTPFQNQNKLSKTYQKSDVFIIPSLFEPWGLTVNEAMAAENAIISSNAVASSYDLVLDNVNGFKFKNGNSKDLANKIFKIYQNKKKIKKYQSNSLKIISE